jgi:hypothetical protein
MFAASSSTTKRRDRGETLSKSATAGCGLIVFDAHVINGQIGSSPGKRDQTDLIRPPPPVSPYRSPDPSGGVSPV